MRKKESVQILVPNLWILWFNICDSKWWSPVWNM